MHDARGERGGVGREPPHDVGVDDLLFPLVVTIEDEEEAASRAGIVEARQMMGQVLVVPEQALHPICLATCINIGWKQDIFFEVHVPCERIAQPPRMFQVAAQCARQRPLDDRVIATQVFGQADGCGGPCHQGGATRGIRIQRMPEDGLTASLQGGVQLPTGFSDRAYQPALTHRQGIEHRRQFRRVAGLHDGGLLQERGTHVLRCRGGHGLVRMYGQLEAGIPGICCNAPAPTRRNPVLLARP